MKSRDLPPRQPPHSIEAEISVLGALLLNNELWFEMADRLAERDFYRREHQVIYAAISRMISAGESCDFVTLTERMRAAGTIDESCGAAYIASLAVDTYSIANSLAYAGIVKERAVLRQLIGVGAEIAQLGYEPAGRLAGELLEHAEQRLFAVREPNARGDGGVHISPLVDQAHARIEKVKEHHGFPGLTTGFKQLDYETQGLEPGDLVIIAARPSMGKTSFATCIAENVAIGRNTPVAIFSLEMTGAQIALRILSSYGRVPLRHLRSGQLTDADYSRLAQTEPMIREAPIYVDETPSLTPLDLRARARRMQARYGIQLVIVDYIQLMQAPHSENRTNEIAEISRSLKGLAKELKVPVIALSQLNRGVENRDNKRPRLADLRESGSIEQDADLVLFVYRDEVYDPATKDRGTAEIIIGKQRNGPLGTVKTAFLGEFTRFENLADASYEPA